jgi:carbon-monoxide dehydrogenase medium subunit
MNHSPEVKAYYPGLIDSTHLIGGVQIQGRASLGGNLCNASPAADGIPNLIAHHATAHIAGPNGQRTLPVEAFCTGPGRNALAPGEFLVALTLPLPPERFGAAYLRFTPRNEMDIAVTGAGTSVVLSQDGRTIESARVALGAVAPTPILVEAISEALAGQPVSEETFERAAALASEAARPITDMRGTIAQRKHLAGILTKRTLRIAVDRARGIQTVDSRGRLNGAHG